MSTKRITSVVSVIPVTDFESALAWYQKLLGREPDMSPMDGIAEWQIVQNAWLQVSLDPERQGNTTVVLTVDNLEAQMDICLRAGVSLGEVVEYPGVVRMADAIDPAGNKVCFVQDISAASGH